MFTGAELLLAEDPRVILTKNAVIERVYDHFGMLSRKLFEIYKPLEPIYPELFAVVPKISKGEKYQGFPWVMLDFPRCFHSETGHFAHRTFFWWGHYFLINLQVSGKYAAPLLKTLAGQGFSKEKGGYTIWGGIPDEIWDFSLPQPGLLPLDQAIFPDTLPLGQIIKLAVSIPIANGPDLEGLTQSLGNELVDIYR